MFDFFFIFNLVALMYVWFETDGVVEWGRLLRLKFLKYEEFEANKRSAFPITPYIQFISCKYGEKYFIIRLLSCPICTSVVCNILWCIYSWHYSLGSNIIATWMIYGMVKYYTKKSNE